MPNPPLPTGSANQYLEIGSPSAEMKQPDFSVSDDGRGLMEASVKSYHRTNTSSPRIPSGVPRKGEKHPSISELVCYKSNFTFQRNNIGYCQADYIGLKKDPTEGDWEVSSSSSDLPMVFHPRFDELAVKVKGDPTKVPAKPTEFQPWVEQTEGARPTFKAFLDTSKFDKVHNLKGIETFLSFNLGCRVTFYTAKQNVLAAIFGGLGKTRASPYQAPDSLKTSNGTNWLLTSASANQYGTIFRVQSEWTLSGGTSPHNKYIYGEFSL